MSNEQSPFSESLIAIYRETIATIYDFVARRTTGSKELAEDVVQETYLRAASAWRSKMPDSPEAWLRTVARNILASHYRRHTPQSLPDGDVEAVLAADESDGRRARATVCWGLARVSPRHARVLEEFYINSRPVRDIAQSLGTTERAVEGRLRRARHALKKVLTNSHTNGELT